MSRFQTHNEEAAEDWLLSYADMITLLMAFFILLVSVSKIDANLYEEVGSGMAKEIGNREVGKPIAEMKKELNDVVTAYDTGGLADVGTDDRGLVLNLDSGQMFRPGSAEIKPEARKLMAEMAQTLAQKRFDNYRIEIQGHTDNVPVKTAAFPSNWELSNARALATLKLMLELGVPEPRLFMSAFAQYSPRAPNETEDGRPLPENQAINRRVSIRVYPR